jgi:hypothetical protein
MTCKKIIHILSLFAAISFACIACQRELNFDGNAVPSVGELVANSAGDCAPVNIAGIYKGDSATSAANYIEVRVKVSVAGNYDIITDTTNGLYFRGTGRVPAGVSTVKLSAIGKPTTGGSFQYRAYYGTSVCYFIVPVLDNLNGAADYTLAGAPGNCTTPQINGTYTEGVALNATNSLAVQVNVTKIGVYDIKATSLNGFLFSATGTFTNTGVQTITLKGSGTPVTAGATSLTVKGGQSACVINIDVRPAAGSTSLFTLVGAPATCQGIQLNGTYQPGIPLTLTNTVDINVNVLSIGTYRIITNSANGFSFGGSGTFNTTGLQSVSLTALGTPAAVGTFLFAATAGSNNSCSFLVISGATSTPASFTLSGAPNTCTAPVVAGAYNVNTPLNATNTIVLQVNVTTVGFYTISTNPVAGMSFNAAGIFTSTGLQTITLVGAGTPNATGVHTFTPQIGNSTCAFDITVGASASNIFQCKIDGVLKTFVINATASYPSPGRLVIRGNNAAGSPEQFVLEIDKSTATNTAIVSGIYVNTVAASTSGQYVLKPVYTDAANAPWSPSGLASPSPDPFSVFVSSISSTRVIGTFTGVVRNNGGAGTTTKSITEGEFNLPVN